MNKVAAIFFLMAFTHQSVAADDTYAAVVAGKECQESSNQSLSCSYKVGESLHVEIAGIGSPDTGIAFLKSDFDGDYYGKYGMLHGCVIVSETQDLFDVAFISPRNGKIYKTWQECSSAM